MDLKECVRSEIQTLDMLREGDRVIAGVSGGADSVCLFLLLSELSQEMGFSMTVLHVEHGIRGEESREDAAFVEELCKFHGIRCRTVSVDAVACSKKEKVSLEEAARILRYREFYRAQQEEKQELSVDARVRVAVAHHRDDQAETMLFHLIRGSSVKGLGGIQAVQNNLIRPLIKVSRGMILQYLTEKQQIYREDQTNQDITYSRNRIRERVMPELLKINSAAALHIAEAAEELAEVQTFLEAETKKAMERTVLREKNLILQREAFLSLPALLQRNVVYEALGEAAGSKKDITRSHVEDVIALMEKQSGRQLSLPYAVNAQRIYRGIRLVRLHTGAAEITAGKTEEELQNLVQMRIFDAPPEPQIPKKKYTKWFDYDKIKYPLLVRTRRSGDFITVGDRARKTLKKYFIDEKIPGEERGSLPLLCDGNHVVWAIGYRISEHYKVTDQTKRIIEAVYLGGLKNE